MIHLSEGKRSPGRIHGAVCPDVTALAYLFASTWDGGRNSFDAPVCASLPLSSLLYTLRNLSFSSSKGTGKKRGRDGGWPINRHVSDHNCEFLVTTYLDAPIESSKCLGCQKMGRVYTRCVVHILHELLRAWYQRRASFSLKNPTLTYHSGPRLSSTPLIHASLLGFLLASCLVSRLTS